MKPAIIAHRGASASAPENTLPAFELAWKLGADGIEGDFHLTADGQIVCIHDARTRRVAGKDLAVAASSLNALRALDVGAWYDKAFKGTRIPTLAQVLATVPPSGKMYIELKSGPAIIPKLLEILSASPCETSRIVIISFDAGVLRTLKSAAPHLKAIWLSAMDKDASGQTTPYLSTVLETLKQIKADGLSTSKNLDDPAYIKAILDNGYEYHVWTVDNPDDAKRFMRWGAMSITTNRPDHIKKQMV